jgi:hypothetical protein
MKLLLFLNPRKLSHEMVSYKTQQAVIECGCDAKIGERRAVQKLGWALPIFARVFVNF